MNREKIRIIVAPFARTTQTILSVKPNASILVEILLAIVSKIRGAGKSAMTNVIHICQVAEKMTVVILNDNSHVFTKVSFIWRKYFQKISRIKIQVTFDIKKSMYPFCYRKVACRGVIEAQKIYRPLASLQSVQRR